MLNFLFDSVVQVFDLLTSFRIAFEVGYTRFSFPFLYIFIAGIATAIVVNAFWKGVRV